MIEELPEFELPHIDFDSLFTKHAPESDIKREELPDWLVEVTEEFEKQKRHSHPSQQQTPKRKVSISDMTRPQKREAGVPQKIYTGLGSLVLDKEPGLGFASREITVGHMIDWNAIPIPEGKEPGEWKKEMHVALHENLGFEDFNFKVYRKDMPQQEGVMITRALDSPEEAGKTPNVYLLLHGWTGTHEIFERGVVQDILKGDPNAIIIAPDGNGFGETNFRSDLKFSELAEKSTVKAYADQTEFLLRNVLGFSETDIRKLNIMGHSMGGATAMNLAARGIGVDGNVVAVAPALMGKENLPKDYVSPEAEVLEGEDALPAAQKKDIAKTYDFLFRLIGAGHVIGRIPSFGVSEKVSTRSTELAFRYLMADFLMGAGNNGDVSPAQFALLMEDLKPLHGKQLLEKRQLSAATMQNLAESVDVDDFSGGELYLMSKVHYVLGSNDRLGGGSGLEAVLDKIKSVKPIDDVEVIDHAGHYAPMYSKKVIKKLVA